MTVYKSTLPVRLIRVGGFELISLRWQRCVRNRFFLPEYTRPRLFERHARLTLTFGCCSIAYTSGPSFLYISPSRCFSNTLLKLIWLPNSESKFFSTFCNRWYPTAQIPRCGNRCLFPIARLAHVDSIVCLNSEHDASRDMVDNYWTPCFEMKLFDLRNNVYFF